MYHHRIPCYGDLTPGIPDVVDSKPAERLALLLPDNLYRRSGDQEFLEKTQKDIAPDLLTSCYACLRLQVGTGDLKAALAVAKDFSPRVMRAGDHEVLVDISGLGRLIGPPEEIERQLAHAVFDAGLQASVAIGRTQTIARLLAATGNGVTLRHKDHKAHEDHKEPLPKEPVPKILCGLCDLRGLCAGTCGRGPWPLLPLSLLRDVEVLPPATNERDRVRPYETFERWGIVTLGDLAALPAADLSSRLGRRGVALQRLARGLDLRPFVPDRDTPRFMERLELEWPIDTLEPLSFVLARMLDPLSDALERADRGAVAIRLELRLTDRSTFARVLPLPAPMRDARVLRTLLLLALESSPPPAGIDVVAIELDPAPARIFRYSLLERALPSPETLSTLTARLSALVGESRVGAAVLLDSHAPDAVEVARFALEARGPMPDAREDHRPSMSVLRRQRVPPAIRVAVERGRPVHIAASRRGIPYGAIAEAAGPWRSSGGWWTDGRAEGQGPGDRAEGKGPGDGAQARAEGRGPGDGAWDRDEWDVALKSGAVCRIFRDRCMDRWFLEGIYD